LKAAMVLNGPVSWEEEEEEYNWQFGC
jgi:hypothetical protein